MAFGVLTTNTPEEALERAMPDRTNKGWEAALAAIEMAHAHPPPGRVDADGTARVTRQR